MELNAASVAAELWAIGRAFVVFNAYSSCPARANQKTRPTTTAIATRGARGPPLREAAAPAAAGRPARGLASATASSVSGRKNSRWARRRSPRQPYRPTKDSRRTGPGSPISALAVRPPQRSTGIEFVLNHYRPLRRTGLGLARPRRAKRLEVALDREGKAAARAEREGGLRCAAPARVRAATRVSGSSPTSSSAAPTARRCAPASCPTTRRSRRARSSRRPRPRPRGRARASNILLPPRTPKADGIRPRVAGPRQPHAATRERVSGARARLRARAHRETLTEAGDVPGTLAYISPEQAPRAARRGRSVGGGVMWESRGAAWRSCCDGARDRGRRALRRPADGSCASSTARSRPTRARRPTARALAVLAATSASVPRPA